MTITTKFIVATPQGIEALLMLTRELAMEKFSSLLEQDMIDRYMADNFNEQTLRAEVNSMSNQWLAVYVDHNPAGYARITSRGRKPAILDGKRVIRIADLGILSTYPEPAIRDALLEKCLTVCKPYAAVWVNEYAGSPAIALFESKGFVWQPGSWQLEELPLASVCLIAEQCG